MECVGGPLDGQVLESTADVVELEGTPGRYVKWRDTPDHDPDWWIKGLPAPVMTERYLRWQEPGEERESPGVEALRAVFRATF